MCSYVMKCMMTYCKQMARPTYFDIVPTDLNDFIVAAAGSVSMCLCVRLS